MEKKNKNNGITLISLIITIIILIVLAGISISSIMNGGLITKAQIARENVKNSEVEEKIELLKYEIETEFDNTNTLKKKMIDEKLIDEKEINQKGISKICNNDNFIAISNFAGLKQLSEEINSGNDYFGKTIYLIDNIDGMANFNSVTGELLSGEKFNPIGDSNSTIEDEELEGSVKKEFNGIFNGLNYAIEKIYINENEENTYCTGIFGYVGENGIVENVSVKDSYISGYFETGSVVGRNKGTINNCKNYCSIKANKLTGGIVGRNCGIIENCINYGNINATEIQVGGIAGNCDFGKVAVKKCKNYGNVNSIKNTIGGIVGGAYRSSSETEVEIIDCQNYGTIGNIENNNQSIGGIAGTLCNTVENCVNYGSVSGKTYIGGIVGYTGFMNNFSTLIERSKNSGKINGKYCCVGGICGWNGAGKILECSNSGEVILNGEEAYYGVGGIAGASSSTQTDTYIEKCYNKGKVKLEITNSKTCQAAGIVGNMGMGREGDNNNFIGYIKNCYNIGEVISEGNIKKTGIAGIVSWARNATVENCYNIGKLTGTKMAGVVNAYADSTFKNNYWLNSCGASFGIGQENSNLGAEPKNTEEMKKLAEILGNAYGQDNTINGGYPYLIENKPE